MDKKIYIFVFENDLCYYFINFCSIFVHIYSF